MSERRSLREWLRADPGLALLLAALVAAAAIYAATITRGLVNYDDPWLVGDNYLLQRPSMASLHAIWLGFDRETRFLLGAEYLPVRDLSIMLDGIVWGRWWGGFHLTNVLVYLGAIAAWFAALAAFGIDRRVAGVMALLWALHPTHAESVAWLAERKGVLGALFAGLAALGYAKFRAGRPPRWLVLAALATACAVWSKALSAFAIAALGGLELVLPARRVSWRRSLVGLGVIGALGAAAFAPVVMVAIDDAVVGSGGQEAPAGWAAMVLGILGFDLELAAMLRASSPSYRIAIAGPTALDLAVGAIGLVVLVAVAVVPARGRWRPPPELRAAAVLWLVCWFPSSRLVLPLKAVLISDRYLLLPTLGTSLALAVGITRIASPRARRALLATIVLASALRTIDAQSNWRDNETLWKRATQANPADGYAWSMYAEALMEDGKHDVAFEVIREGLQHSRAPRLLLRKALLVVWGGKKQQAIGAMRDAAVAGEPRAMLNLALLLDQAKQSPEEAMDWAKRAVAQLPYTASAHRALGVVALHQRQPGLALVHLERALHYEPYNPQNKYNLALALIGVWRLPEATAVLEALRGDPAYGWRAVKLLEAIAATSKAMPR
ncbi:MAG: hypothetical protein JNL83_15380 [Myxococcales bacterium]|nr:hypothetical protein [Myxococcales bacterium]